MHSDWFTPGGQRSEPWYPQATAQTVILSGTDLQSTIGNSSMAR